ncbi:MAG: hypothetical protein EPN93_07765 [Spirochaetes bacterium]|nr:MAG: hypothetical protein EPN93_07765 [Spirochaetota bacterium]
MGNDVRKMFLEVVVNSLDTRQVDFLGESMNSRFSLKRLSGFGESVPVPRQTAAQVLLDNFPDENDIVKMFSFMLAHEGERFYNRTLLIWGKEEFIALLRKHKWIFDRELIHFLRDPFYEHEINFLKKVRLLDLRDEFPFDDIIADISRVSTRMGIRDLEWRISLRLYDILPKIGELVKKIIELLLTRQNLQEFHGEIFICLRELATNASKANYKLLFEKYFTSPAGITAETDYPEFLRLFKDELGEHGSSRLIEYARKDDMFFTITFQSTMESIEVWVTNNQNITVLEKQQLMKKIGMRYSWEASFAEDSDEFVEGAGLGLMLIQKILGNFSQGEQLLSVVFYPDTMKIGFSLARADLQKKSKAKKEA